MLTRIAPPPPTEVEPVVDVYHGIEVVDPYRWLEDQNSPRTRAWIAEQTRYARAYLDALPHRDEIRRRVEELFAIETISELCHVQGQCYFVRRAPGDEQAKLWVREGPDGEGRFGADRLLLDPLVFDPQGTISLSILDITDDGALIAVGLRYGGYGGRSVRILNTLTAELLEDALPVGAVRGFRFLADGRAFVYVLEQLPRGRHLKAAKLHRMGTPVSDDEILFDAGDGDNVRLLTAFDRGAGWMLHTIVRQEHGRVLHSAWLQPINDSAPLRRLYEDEQGTIDTRLKDGFVWLRRDAGPIQVLSPNEPRVVRFSVPVQAVDGGRWMTAGKRLLVQRVVEFRDVVHILDLDGTPLFELSQPGAGSVKILFTSASLVFLTWESFDAPPSTYLVDLASRRCMPFSANARKADVEMHVRRLWATSPDGAQVPITLVGTPEALNSQSVPTLLTGYGAAGISLTPRYSQLATWLIEHRGLFALAHCRGGGELGKEWQAAGSGANRNNSFDDFIVCAEHLIQKGFTKPSKLAIAGGSNSGLLVGVAMTRRPELFRCVICVAPVLDMLRYHRFQNSQFYVDDVGSPEVAEQFSVLRSYSPYERIEPRKKYPALLMVSGDQDTRCDGMHARKFVARLQAADEEASVLLDHSGVRGHWPVLPLAIRVNALTDRIAFSADELEIEP
jgi:prolyl oligopeptidase